MTTPLEKKDYKYIAFELHLINDIKPNLGLILHYGLVKYSKQFTHIDLNDIVNVVHKIYSENRVLDDDFTFYYKNLIWNDYNLQTEYDNHQLAKAKNRKLNTGYNYMNFYNECLAITQIYFAAKNLGDINIPNYKRLLADYNSVFDKVYLFEAEFGKDALVMFSVNMFADYMRKDKSHREYELLRAYLAIKSLQGSKQMVGTNKAAIIQRMIGARSNQVMKHFLSNKSTKSASNKMYKRFNERYFFDQLIIELLQKNFIQSKITKGRTTYFSTQLSMHELPTAIAYFKNPNNISVYKQKFKAQERNAKIELDKLLKNSVL